MITPLLVAALLLGTPTGPGGPPATPTAETPRLVFRTDVAPERVQSAPSWSVPIELPLAQLWFNAGYGTINEQYNDDGDTEDLGESSPLPENLRAVLGGLGISLPAGVEGKLNNASATLTGEIAVLNVHVGGLVNVYRQPKYSVGLGADLGLASQNFTADRLTYNLQNATVDIPALGLTGAPLSAAAAALGVTQLPTGSDSNRKIKSGFKAQNVTVFTQIASACMAGRFGFLLDVGPEPNLAADERENTDRQNAFLLSLAGEHVMEAVRLFGGAEGFFTLDNKEGGQTYDEGDTYAFQAGAGYRFGFGEIGAALTYRYRTDGDNIGVVAGTSQVFLDERNAGHHIGIAPYLNIAPAGAPYLFYAKGGVQDEYEDYTLSIAGKNDFAPKLGLTAGMIYSF